MCWFNELTLISIFTLLMGFLKCELLFYNRDYLLGPLTIKKSFNTLKIDTFYKESHSFCLLFLFVPELISSNKSTAQSRKSACNKPEPWSYYQSIEEH